MHSNPIPITVITGFLGSGKTTLLSHLLKQKEMARTAVIINEFGEVGLDHALIERPDDHIIELQSGCICCTIKEDLEKTLLSLIQYRQTGSGAPFERLVIETTGLADPVPIIHTLMKLQKHYILDGVITLVDAVNGLQTLDTQVESVRQAAMAEVILLSKTDLANIETQEKLIKRLKNLNPAVKVIPVDHGDFPATKLLELGSYQLYNKSKDVRSWLSAEKYHHNHHHHHHHHHHNINRHGDNIQAFSIISDKPLSKTAFSAFIDAMAAQVGDDFLRMKGILNVVGEDKPAVVHGVQNLFHSIQWLDDWPDEDKRSKLIFIIRNTPQTQVENLFNQIINQE